MKNNYDDRNKENAILMLIISIELNREKIGSIRVSK
jgi:hypothetical protein